MRRPLLLTLLIVLALAAPVLNVDAQDTPYPLPAPLYILTSDGMLLHIDPATGAQTEISNPNQPVADFDVAPSGDWIVFRTADEGVVIVRQINGQSGYVLEFETVPPASGPAPTIAWSPTAEAIAYIVPQGVRVAYPGAGPYGEADFGLIQGNWSELYWEGADSLIVSDSSGATTRISGSYERWTIEPATAQAARPQPVVPSSLSAAGVMLNNQPLPGTAGALAFDWGPLPPDAITGYELPASLYFIAPDANGSDQVWQLPDDATPVQQITSDSDPVTGYGISPDGQRIAYVAGAALIVQGADGATQQLAPLENEYARVTPQWSPDGTQIAYHDQRGVWVIPADGSLAPRLVAQSVHFTEQTNPGDVRGYLDPQWHADGTRLLVVVGLWEGSGLGIVDLSTNTLTELLNVVTSSGTWTADARILAWSWYYGYSEPGLFLLDPAQPDAEPLTLLAGTAVWDVVRGSAGDWYAIVSAGTEMGPRLLTVWQTPSLDRDFAPVFDNTTGGFADRARLATDGARFMIAGVQSQTPTQHENGSGELRLIDVSHDMTVRLAQPYPVHNLQWGP